MKRMINILILCMLLLITTSCNKKNDKAVQEQTTEIEWSFTRDVARKIFDDGWVYSFVYEHNKDIAYEDNPKVNCHFFGINLRYRYNDDYTTSIKYSENKVLKTKEVPSTILLLGASKKTPEINRDMEKIAELLKYDGGTVTRDELLAIKDGDLSFEELDEKLFIELMRESLTMEPGSHGEGKYIELPSYALLTEPEYLDDCKFQIGYLNAVGLIDVIYIDVLYKTGDDYNSYTQLSDLVEVGKATPEQKELYALIQNISKGIVDENNLLYGIDENTDKTISGVDIGRLYHFLSDIENDNWYKYVIEES